MIREIILVGAGLIVGSVGTIMYAKYKTIVHDVKDLKIQIDTLYEAIPTPEEMAKKVLSVKLSPNELPPDVYNQIKAEAEKQTIKKPAVKDMEYFG